MINRSRDRAEEEEEEEAKTRSTHPVALAFVSSRIKSVKKRKTIGMCTFLRKKMMKEEEAAAERNHDEKERTEQEARNDAVITGC
jgi:hypothetical protein